MIKISAKVADDFQIKIGGFSIPELLLTETNLESLALNLKSNFQDDDLKKMTGRVLIDLRPDFLNIQMELIDEGGLKEINLSKNRRFTSDLVTVLLQLAILLEVPYFQLIDSSLALANSAFDENSIIEMILEKLNEYQQYDNSMLVFDADTLVGISESLIDSANTDTLSYSFQNGHLWQQIILNVFKSEFSSQFGAKHRWCVIISSNEFLINQFKKMTKFEYCHKESSFLVKERTCVNCNMKYIQKENRKDSCLYHPKRELELISKGRSIDTKKVPFSIGRS